MGTIRERKNSDGKRRFQAIVELKGFPIYRETFERKGDAKAWVQKTESGLREGRHFPTHESRRRTLADLIDDYLQRGFAHKPASKGKQEAQLGWWKDQLGAFALVHITPSRVADKRDVLLDGKTIRHTTRSPATVNRYLAALSACFTYAVKVRHWVDDNPVRRVAKGREGNGRLRYLSREEIVRLLKACAASECESLELIVRLALTTGMRYGEIMGMRWSDMDLDRGIIVLNKTKNRDRRAVPIVASVRPLLDEHGKVRHLGNDLVFSDGNHHPAPLRIRKPFELALEEAKIVDFRFHDLRHTAASYLAMSGATTAEIAAVLGHRTLAMVKRYAHLSEQHTASVVERMTAKIFG